jgi:hypothetical protein
MCLLSRNIFWGTRITQIFPNRKFAFICVNLCPFFIGELFGDQRV